MSGIPNRVSNDFSSAVFMIGMAIFMRGLWAVSSLSRSEIEISGMEWQDLRIREGAPCFHLAFMLIFSFKNFHENPLYTVHCFFLSL